MEQDPLIDEKTRAREKEWSVIIWLSLFTPLFSMMGSFLGVYFEQYFESDFAMLGTVLIVLAILGTFNGYICRKRQGKILTGIFTGVFSSIAASALPIIFTYSIWRGPADPRGIIKLFSFGMLFPFGSYFLCYYLMVLNKLKLF